MEKIDYNNFFYILIIFNSYNNYNIYILKKELIKKKKLERG